MAQSSFPWNGVSVPVALITSEAADTVDGPFSVSIAFTETVTGFTAADITVTNGTVTDFAGSGTAYTCVVNPASAGTVTVEIAAGVCLDADENANIEGNMLTRTYSPDGDADVTSPTVVLSSAAGDPVSEAFEVTATFSESVTGFEVGDVTVTNGSAGSFSGSGDTYTFTITPSDIGAVTVQVGAGVCADAAGNSNEASNTLSRDYQQPYEDKIASAGSVFAYYKLDQTTGVLAEDSSSNAYHGSVIDIDWAADTFEYGGNAALLNGPSDPDGTRDYIELPAGFRSAFPVSEGTIVAWFKIPSLAEWTNGEGSIFEFDDFLLRRTAAGTLFYKAAGRNIQSSAQTSTDWMVAAMRWNMATDEMKVYVGGTPFSTLTGLTLQSAPTTAYIGTRTISIGFLYAYLAHLVVYDEALSDSAIAALA